MQFFNFEVNLCCCILYLWKIIPNFLRYFTCKSSIWRFIYISYIFTVLVVQAYGVQSQLYPSNSANDLPARPILSADVPHTMPCPGYVLGRSVVASKALSTIA